ncbi:MAG: hypothetical protein GF417_11475 [Candidatus Latescibacteria bacterium]|nr:hypothetical protein [bacterium]MBD3425044.1 hypothetical protein [Candidatus Latescibacterota bacterium]
MIDMIVSRGEMKRTTGFIIESFIRGKTGSDKEENVNDSSKSLSLIW